MNFGDQTHWKRWLGRIGPLLGLLLLFAFFAMVAPPSFRSVRNLETIARQTTIVGLGALGMTAVIIAGGIDLSIGSMVALATVVTACCLNLAGIGPVAAALMAVLACALCGGLNGLLVTRLRVVPFIVTMGMMLLVRGVAKGLSHEQKIDAPETWLNELLASLPADRRWMLVPAGVWILVAMSILMVLMLRYTRLGRHTFAIGSNEHTARLCGVAVDRVKILIYTLCGFFAGMAGGDAVFAVDRGGSDRGGGIGIGCHRRGGHWRGEPCRRGRFDFGQFGGRLDYVGDPVGLFPDGDVQLGSGDPDRNDYCRGGGLGSFASSESGVD